MVNKLTLLALLVSVVFLCSCAALRQLIKKPSVSFDSMYLKNMSLFEGTMVFKFKLTNPNPIGANLSNLSYNLKIEQNEFIKGVVDKGINLSPGGTEIVELPITVNYLKFFETIQEFVQKDEVSYDLSGSFDIMSFNIPYHTDGKLTIPKLPKVSLKSVDVGDINLMGANLNFVLELDNSNPFAVAIIGLDYGIKLSSTRFVDGEARSITNLSQNGKSTMQISLTNQSII